MVPRVLFLAMGVAAQVIGVPSGAICQAKLVPYTNSTPYADSNLFTNNATADFNSPILHLDTLQLWSESWGGSTGLLTGNPPLDQLDEPNADDVGPMIGRMYVKDLKANTTYFTRAFSARVYGETMAFRILSEPSANPMLLEYGVFGTWVKTRKGDSPVYAPDYERTLSRSIPCKWINYPAA